ncbi:hypothetical protein D1614_04300 [Maribellus luteus]|uniref:Uncharacterized protein n=1 Tax=Maribellus luteus TaxID=2305463 RepID=A0A399T738_9BACT|nr:hypothetical protein D1614_04300 [Maribellus luteus]
MNKQLANNSRQTNKPSSVFKTLKCLTYLLCPMCLMWFIKQFANGLMPCSTDRIPEVKTGTTEREK